MILQFKSLLKNLKSLGPPIYYLLRASLCDKGMLAVKPT